MTLMPVLMSIFALAQVFRLLGKFRREAIGFRALILWSGLWIAISFVSTYPDSLNTLAAIAGIEHRLNFALSVAILILFAVVVELNSRLDSLSHEMRRAIQELALANLRIDDLVENSDGNKTKIENEKSKQ